jgi:glycosyltransferase involved in cell wall biosynthesis
MKLSVVICTRDRPDTVGQAIESVAECDFPSRYDIHIMDQSTNTQTRDIVHGLAQRFAGKCDIVYHFLDKAGLSRAYNAGMRVSTGDIVAGTDDDVVVPKDWLVEIDRAFASDPQLGLLYGQVLVPESLKEAERTGELIVPHLLIKKRERLAQGQGFKIFGMGANMAIRRSSFELVGGFDEALGGGGPLRSSQDFDFAFRMYRKNQAVLLAPEVKVDHYGSRTQAQWGGTMKAYGIGDGAFYSKHIRCGDPLALYYFSRVVLYNNARRVKKLLTERRWPEDDYLPSLFVGVRDAAKFGIDRKYRLFRERHAGQMTVTAANAVTGQQRTKGTGS